MKSFFCAVAGFVAGLVAGMKQKKALAPQKAKEETRSSYHFNCWLCNGVTTFTCKPVVGDMFYSIDCCRCGMGNKVKVEASIKTN